MSERSRCSEQVITMGGMRNAIREQAYLVTRGVRPVALVETLALDQDACLVAMTRVAAHAFMQWFARARLQ